MNRHLCIVSCDSVEETEVLLGKYEKAYIGYQERGWFPVQSFIGSVYAEENHETKAFKVVELSHSIDKKGK